MVYVRLEQDWTDSHGSTHVAGAMVDVDVSTLARLEAQGLVEDPAGGDAGTQSWIHPTGGDKGSGSGSGGSGGGTGGSGGGGDDSGGSNGSGGGSGSGGSGGDGDGDGDSWINPTGGDQGR